jgi:hypothetical protein
MIEKPVPALDTYDFWRDVNKVQEDLTNLGRVFVHDNDDFTYVVTEVDRDSDGDMIVEVRRVL